MKTNEVIILLLVLLSLSVPATSYHQSTIDQLTESLVAERRDHRTEAAQYEREKAIFNRRLQPVSYETPIDKAVMTSGCGYRMDPMGGGTEGLHKGVDLVGPEGSPIKAALSGFVVEHWPAPDGYYTGHPIYGGLVVIESDGLFLLYGHLEDTQVHEGEWIEAGDDIGVMGDNGVSTGPHLHFEVVVDPLKYLEDMRCQ